VVAVGSVDAARSETASQDWFLVMLAAATLGPLAIAFVHVQSDGVALYALLIPVLAVQVLRRRLRYPFGTLVIHLGCVFFFGRPISPTTRSSW
jgi:hypothetical protein